MGNQEQSSYWSAPTSSLEYGISELGHQVYDAFPSPSENIGNELQRLLYLSWYDSTSNTALNTYAS